MTQEFPYGNGETFLETEILHLSSAFDKVTIVSNSQESEQFRPVPENCSVISRQNQFGSIDKLKAIFGVFSPIFWKEIVIIKKIYKKPITKGIINTALVSLYRGKKTKKYCQTLMRKGYHDSEFYFYSYWYDDAALGIAMLQKEYVGTRCISRIHGWDVYFEVSDVGYLPFRHFIANNLKRIYSISQRGKEYCRDVWKVSNAEKIEVSRLGVNAQKAPERSLDIKRATIVSCSSLIPLKRVEYIVRALSQIASLPVHWVHFGDGPLFTSIESLANEILPENISWELKGHVSNYDVMEWYSEHCVDLFINVSSSEGVPVSIMEAMSFGVPVIATNVGGNGEIVNDQNGRLVTSDPTIDELSSSILEMLNSLEDLAIKRKAAKNTWETKYNADQNYKDFISRAKELGGH